jgi:hypothetical protein
MDATPADTMRWLEPMLEACESQNSTRDERESMKLHASAVAGDEAVGPELDMVRFGQLLRERLGWVDYPSAPEPAGDSH